MSSRNGSINSKYQAGRDSARRSKGSVANRNQIRGSKLGVIDSRVLEHVCRIYCHVNLRDFPRDFQEFAGVHA